VRSARQKSLEITPVGKTRFPTGLGISASGAWLVTIAAHKAYVVPTADLKSGFTKFVSPERLLCLVFHPTEDHFTTGDDKGVIRSWYCLRQDLMGRADTEKRAQTTTLHWHAHAVAGLAYTPNGAYLLSGGEESVLVLWQLHTGKREYVPRVGASINGIAVSKAGERDEEYLLALADASFVFVSSASLKISRAFARIKLGENVAILSVEYCLTNPLRQTLTYLTWSLLSTSRRHSRFTPRLQPSFFPPPILHLFRPTRPRHHSSRLNWKFLRRIASLAPRIHRLSLRVSYSARYCLTASGWQPSMPERETRGDGERFTSRCGGGTLTAGPGLSTPG
jgi:hypothetical protein